MASDGYQLLGRACLVLNSRAVDPSRTPQSHWGLGWGWGVVTAAERAVVWLSVCIIMCHTQCLKSGVQIANTHNSFAAVLVTNCKERCAVRENKRL